MNERLEIDPDEVREPQISRAKAPGFDGGIPCSRSRECRLSLVVDLSDREATADPHHRSGDSFRCGTGEGSAEESGRHDRT